MINNLIKKAKGFTLIETLVAVLLLATAIAGPLTIASKSLLAALVAKDQVTAFFLAQDAVEYVRFVRDTNKLRGGDWLTGAGGSSAGIDLTPCTQSNGCYFDSTTSNPSVPTACQNNGCIQATFSSSRFVCYDPSVNRFRYNTNAACTGVSGVEKTLFARQVAITTPSSGSGSERLVTVTVSWTDTANKVRSVTVRETIFDWQ